MMYDSRVEVIALIAIIVLLAISGGILCEAWQESKEAEYEQCIGSGDHRPTGDQRGHCIRDSQRTTLWQYIDYPGCAETTRDTPIRGDSSDAAYQLWRRRIDEKRGVA